MAGTSKSFNATAFRTAIRAAMTMGTPPAAADALKFYWNPVTTVTATKDGEGIPFDPTATVTRADARSVSKPCALEYLDATGTGHPTPFGSVVPSRVRVTLLDEDYAVVADANFVVIGGDRYIRHHEPPAVGLFSVGVHQIVYIAENDL